MAVALIECSAGASGDMFLGAWLSLGVSQDDLRRHLAGLSVKEFELSIDNVMKQGVAAVKVDVLTHHSHHHRHLPDIERIIDESDLPDVVKIRSKEAFYHLAVAEAKVHATTPDKIHFHEVGAVDAIIDIVGSMISWHLLGEPECAVSVIEVGGGTVQCAHGLMPVPAPATAELLQGFPTKSFGTIGETTTPTGAAIIKTLAKPRWQRSFVSARTGYGAGTKELPMANVLRIQLGEWVAHDDCAKVDSELPTPTGATVIEANIDDMNPELAGYTLDRLMAAGAMDAWWVPITMKKGRPGVQLRVLCTPDKVEYFEREIFRQTSTIGLRYYSVMKSELPREIIKVHTSFGDLPVKVARLGSHVINTAPEYEVCKQTAEARDVPVKVVYQAALAAAQHLYGEQ